MSKQVQHCLFILSVLIGLSGCIAVSVVSATVGVATTVVGGAIDVVDAVTPDILDDEDDDDDEDDKEEKPEGVQQNDKAD